MKNIYTIQPQQNVFDGLLSAGGNVSDSMFFLVQANDDISFDWTVSDYDEIDRGTTDEIDSDVLMSYKKRGHVPVNSYSLNDTDGDFVPIAVGIGIAIIETNFEIG